MSYIKITFQPGRGCFSPDNIVKLIGDKKKLIKDTVATRMDLLG